MAFEPTPPDRVPEPDPTAELLTVLKMVNRQARQSQAFSIANTLALCAMIVTRRNPDRFQEQFDTMIAGQAEKMPTAEREDLQEIASCLRKAIAAAEVLS
ncbi:MAG: hypothetical protein R3F15_00730 [Lysobacterales bacterium]